MRAQLRPQVEQARARARESTLSASKRTGAPLSRDKPDQLVWAGCSLPLVSTTTAPATGPRIVIIDAQVVPQRCTLKTRHYNPPPDFKQSRARPVWPPARNFTRSQPPPPQRLPKRRRRRRPTVVWPCAGRPAARPGESPRSVGARRSWCLSVCEFEQFAF